MFLKHHSPEDKKGILKTTVGYTGGKNEIKNPSYKDVCSGTTDHAEALKIIFDPSLVSYAELVGALCDASVFHRIINELDPPPLAYTRVLLPNSRSDHHKPTRKQRRNP
jgi:hypothetical protein